MSSVYSPTPVELGDITLVDDGDPKNAAGINTPIEAVADGVAFCQAGLATAQTEIDNLQVLTGLFRVMNWHYLSNAIVKVTSRPFYNAELGIWVVPGLEAILTSADGGQTLDNPAVDDMTGETATGGDADEDGDMVIAAKSRYVFRYNGAWSRVDVYGFAGTLEDVQIVYEPNSGNWVWALYSVSSHAIKVSATGATWADATVFPSGDAWGSDDYELFRMAVNKDSGRIVATVLTTDGVSHSGDDYFVVATSDDGGVNWTTRADIYDAGTDVAEHSSLVYDPIGEAWYFTHGEDDTDTSRVYRSTNNGVTWTLVSTLTAFCITSIACIESMLVATAIQGTARYVVYSLDNGTTWRNTQLVTGFGDVFSGAGSLMLPDNSGLYTSLRFGTTDPVLT